MLSSRLPSTLLALAAAQIDLVVRHHADELKDLLPAGDEARAHVVHVEGLGGRGGRLPGFKCVQPGLETLARPLEHAEVRVDEAEVQERKRCTLRHTLRRRRNRNAGQAWSKKPT